MAEPFLKWVGGKRGLLPNILPHLPEWLVKHRDVNPGLRERTYWEPFVGGGALFFHLEYHNAILLDANDDLISAYEGVQHCVPDVIRLLKEMPTTPEYYAIERAKDPQTLTLGQAAARVIYLNKVGFNGLWRVNKKGIYNVPYGYQEGRVVCDEERLRKASAALQGVTLKTGDFEHDLEHASEGDFVYFDPPYVPLSDTSNFKSYSANGFGMHDQERLRDLALRLKKRGVDVLLSNSSAPAVWELYKHDFELFPVFAKRAINSKGDGRGAVQEWLIK